TVMRLLNALQDLSADADIRLARVDLFYVEQLLGIMLAEFPAQLVSAFGNRAYAAPLAVSDLKNTEDQLLRGLVAIAIEHAGILVFDFRPPRFKLPQRHQRALQNVQRLEAGDNDRDLEAGADRLVFPVSHNGTDVSRPQKSLHPVQWRLQYRSNRRRYQHV